MRVYDKIIQSAKEPPINNLWIHNNSIKHFNNGTWETLNEGVKEPSEEPSSEELEFEYTIIEDNQDINRNSITNLENNTGARTSTKYIPSGHIKKILDSCHRYLGKITLNQKVTKENINDIKSNPDEYLKLSLIQLSDKDSRYYDKGYEYIYTRRKANLDGIQGHGEVGVLIPGFWYKGISYLDENGVRMNYICFSTKEAPTAPKNTISSNLGTPIKQDYYLKYKGSISQGGTYDSYTTSSSGNWVYSVSLQKSSSQTLVRKIKIPATTTSDACVLFSASDGTIIKEVKLPSIKYEGEGIILTVPKEAQNCYFSLKTSQSYSSMVPSTPCKIVQYRSTIDSEDLNLINVKDWIAEMEPEWVYSEPVFIHAGEATKVGNSIYTSFDGTKLPTYTSSGIIALNRVGVSHMSYRSNKLLTILFRAKYGDRESQITLGNGEGTNLRYIGVTSPYGMTDTKAPNEYGGPAIMPIGNTYEEIISPSFLGIENIFGNTAEFLSGLSMQGSPSPGQQSYYGLVKAEGKGEETRYLPVPSPQNQSTVWFINHGKYCDIIATANGGPGIYYDNQLIPNPGTSYNMVRGGDGNPQYGEYYGIFSIGVLLGYYYRGGVRMTYDNNIEVLSDINAFNNLKEIRTTDDITL